MSAQLLMGSATAPFPIAAGTPLGGYLARTETASTTLDELEIGTLVIQSDGQSLVVVTADVIGIDAELVHSIAAATGVDECYLLLAASHTHSGPRGIVHRLHPADAEGVDLDLRTRFIETVAATIVRAVDAVEPVTLNHAESLAKGAWSNRNDPNGANDERLRLLLARRADGTIQTVLALTACHPTILGAESSRVSADLAGGIRRSLRASFAASGVTPTILSLSGAAGDISTRFTRQASDPAEIEHLASLATAGVSESLSASLPVALPRDQSAIRTIHHDLRLPSARDTIEGDVYADLLQAESAMSLATTGDVSEGERRQAITRYQGAYLRSLLKDVPEERFRVRISAWAIGATWAVVAVPGELFTSLGQRIEARSPFALTWVVGYANGYAGYFVDDAAVEAQTYEALASPFAPGTGELIVEAASTLLNEFAKS